MVEDQIIYLQENLLTEQIKIIFIHTNLINFPIRSKINNFFTNGHTRFKKVFKIFNERCILRVLKNNYIIRFRTF